MERSGSDVDELRMPISPAIVEGNSYLVAVLAFRAEYCKESVG